MEKNVPTYKSVLYKEVYPGIDIKFYGNNRQMEYDVIVKPGADPSKVQFAYEGIEGLKIAENGDLEIILHSPTSTKIPPLTEGGKEGLFIPPPLSGGGQGEGESKGEQNKIIQKKPVIYQDIEGKRVAVEGYFKILENAVIVSESKQALPKQSSLLVGEGNGERETGERPYKVSYRFEVAKYNNKYSLIIDPTLVYSTYFGGSGNEWDPSIALDTNGFVYLTGSTPSVNFPVVFPIQEQKLGGKDIFISKINPLGTGIEYSTYLGGNSDDSSYSIAVDSEGAAYICGSTWSNNFPIANAIYGALSGGYDAIVVKINPFGNAIVYSTYIGGSHYDYFHDIAIDSFGAVYVAGESLSNNFPTFSPIIGTLSGISDAIILKINPSGTGIEFSTYLGGSGTEYVSSIDVDINGAVYIAGSTNSNNFPISSPILGTFMGGEWDAFVTKIDPSGTVIEYSTYLGGNNDDFGSGIEVDPNGASYITGYSNSANFPTVASIDGTLSGDSDVFVVKINPSGTGIIFSTYLGGSGSEWSHDIALDTNRAVYITGTTRSIDFPTVSPIDITLSGIKDAFVTKIDGAGLSIIYSSYLGGSYDEEGRSITVDVLGATYISGHTHSDDFPTISAIQGVNGGLMDAFLTKISASDVNTATGTNVIAMLSPGTSLLFDTVTTSGTTAVTTSGTGQPPPSGFKIGNPPIYYEITSTATFSGLVEVCINYDENQFATEQRLKLFHMEGSWKDITTSFSPFIVAEQSSTAVTLSNLSATANGDDVLLTWSTRSETDNEGFVVLRSENPNGPFSPVSSMIPAVGGLGMKAAYTFTDSNVEDGKTYYYRLQDVDSSGRVTEHKVVSVYAGGEKQEENSEKLEVRSKTQETKSKTSETEGKTQASQQITSVVVMESEGTTPPHPALPRKGGGDNEVAHISYPQLDGSLNEAEQLNVNTVSEKQPEKVIVSSADHSNNLKPSRFSVSLEDERGNVVKISSPEADSISADSDFQSLKVTEESGKVILSWLGKGTLKGFILQRSERGKAKFTSISGLIPYFGKNAGDKFVYEFTDKEAKTRNQFEYRLETVKSHEPLARKGE